jgi:hypothetical protein
LNGYTGRYCEIEYRFSYGYTGKYCETDTGICMDTMADTAR